MVPPFFLSRTLFYGINKLVYSVDKRCRSYTVFFSSCWFEPAWTTRLFNWFKKENCVKTNQKLWDFLFKHILGIVNGNWMKPSYLLEKVSWLTFVYISDICTKKQEKETEKGRKITLSNHLKILCVCQPLCFPLFFTFLPAQNAEWRSRKIRLPLKCFHHIILRHEIWYWIVDKGLGDRGSPSSLLPHNKAKART